MLSLLCNQVLEAAVWPKSENEWLAILVLGLMPVGPAFYPWDYAVKHGPIQLLGGSAYLPPVLSALILLVAGIAEMCWQLVLATILVTSGAVQTSGKLSTRISP